MEGISNLPRWTADARAGDADSLLSAPPEAVQEPPPPEFPAILPFSWLPPSGAKELSERDEPRAWSQRVLSFLNERDDIVMSRREAQGVVTGVLLELVDNVRAHAEAQRQNEPRAKAPPRPLLGALNLSQARSAFQQDAGAYYPGEAAYNAWLSKRATPLIALVVGDSGAGVPYTLASDFRRQRARQASGRPRSRSPRPTSSQLILYSFDPNSSRYEDDRQRGLGLAGVRRFVRGYEGRVAIRAGDAFAGYWFPTAAPQLIDETRLAYTPGTTVLVNLGLTLELLRRGASYGSAGEHKPSSLIVVPWDPTRDASLAEIASQEIERQTVAHPIIVVMISEWPEGKRDQVDIALAIRRAAEDLDRRAGVVVVVPGASRIDISSVVSPLDDIGEAGASRAPAWALAEWTPPILIVSGEGAPTWTGASEQVRGILYELLEKPQLPQSQVTETLAAGSPEADYVITDRDWFARTGDSAFRLRVTLTAVEDAISKHVGATINRSFR